jgi:hypothetical protein
MCEDKCEDKCEKKCDDCSCTATTDPCLLDQQNRELTWGTITGPLDFWESTKLLGVDSTLIYYNAGNYIGLCHYRSN